MNLAIPSIDYPGFSTISSTIGFSPASEVIKAFLKESIEHFRKPISIGDPLENALSSLREVREECSVSDWDGYGAFPMTEDAFNEVRELIKLFPSSIPMPEISADPTGAISLEWYRERRLTFVVSLSGEKRLDYAGLFGSNKSYGSEYFGYTLPVVVLENLRRLYK